MTIERAEPRHSAAWVALRSALWPDDAPIAHRAAVARLLDAAPDDAATFIALTADVTVGFVEATRRRDYVNGCDTSPVAFLEGLYVAPDHRRRGVAGQLIAAVRTWARATGCTELASDAGVGNIASHAVHARLGFAETERVVFFRQRLTTP